MQRTTISDALLTVGRPTSERGRGRPSRGELAKRSVRRGTHHENGHRNPVKRHVLAVALF